MKQPATCHYRVFPADPAAHLFEVSCTIAEPDPAGQQLDLPVWIPGSYLVRDFAGRITRIEADCDGDAVEVTKRDKTTWRCAPCSGPLTLRYLFYANDLSVRGAHLDITHGYFNGTVMLLRPAGLAERRCTLELRRPADSRFDDWRVATSMQRAEVDDSGFGLYSAADYEELIDHPVEMGDFDVQHFEAHGIPHRLVVTGRHAGDLARVGRDARKICETHMDMFGAPVPIDRYVFLLTVLGEGYGGLEHRWSSSLMARRDELPAVGAEKVTEAYRRFLGLVSHEYFHLWNVKRIRPAAVARSDYRAEAYTEDLWVFEGVTSYYDDMALLRSGVIDLNSYLELLSNLASIVWLGRGRFTHSLAESSFDAWIKLYRRDDNAPNTQVNYYTKGALTALGLDLVIRQRTGHSKSLDDVMRAVWQRHGVTDVPLEEKQFEAIAAEVAGVGLDDYFDAYVRGIEDPPLGRLLAEMGLRFETAPVPDGATRPMRRKPGTPVPAAMQVGTRDAAGRLILTTVYADGPAQRAGLANGDELVAIDGLRVTPTNFKSLMMMFQPGQTVSVDVFRRDELLRLPVALDPAPDAGVLIAVDKNASDEQLELRKLWLSGRTV